MTVNVNSPSSSFAAPSPSPTSPNTSTSSVLSAVAGERQTQSPGVLEDKSALATSLVTVSEPDTSTAQNSANVCVYVNASCHCGHFLSVRRLQTLPTKIGPGKLCVVLAELVQRIINSALDERKVYNLVKEGSSNISVTVSVGGKSYSKNLVSVVRVSTFWSFLESLLEELGACENLLSSQPLTSPCQKCQQQQQRRHSSMTPASTPGSRMSEDDGDLAASVAQKRRWSTESGDSSRAIKVPAKAPRSRSTLEAEASSTTGDHHMTTVSARPSDPSQWSIDEVVQHINDTDTGLGAYVDLFRRHEIDGKALMLLNSEMMMKYMGLKLGPVLKLCNIIEKLKGRSK